MGAPDMARTLRSGGRPRAAADLALHVLDAMESINSSAASGATARLSTTCASSDFCPRDGTRCGSRLGFTQRPCARGLRMERLAQPPLHQKHGRESIIGRQGYKRS